MNRDGKVRKYYFDASTNIKIVYEDENQFHKLARSLKMYNMVAYKDFIFNLMHKLRTGEIIGEKIEDNIYKVHLISNKVFEFVYGEIYFTYRLEGNKATLITIEPKDILFEGHRKQLQTYKGVPINSSKDRFRVDMYYNMGLDKEKNI